MCFVADPLRCSQKNPLGVLGVFHFGTLCGKHCFLPDLCLEQFAKWQRVQKGQKQAKTASKNMSEVKDGLNYFFRIQQNKNPSESQ